ncbi:hypothetical protein NESM_000621900 [Novymonas esmeraldas]|uniref:Uncharacterized protein n=1 Tax=Novymonas esmeraldas TaxID=1808958 RepID=A0AAW0EV16_9TRYP
MSRLAAAAAVCPLSDCTLAADNAENIRNRSDAAVPKVKTVVTAAASPRTSRARALLRNVKSIKGSSADVATAAVEESTLSVRREPSTSISRHSSFATTPSTRVSCAAVVPLSAPPATHRPSPLDCHVFAKPFTPAATPRRHDPYSPCLLKSPCTPEDGFYACYCPVEEEETEEEEATAAAAAVVVTELTASHTPVQHHMFCPTPTLPAETRALLEMLSKTSTAALLCMSPSETPVKAADSVVEYSPVPSSAAGGLSAAPSPSSTPNRGASLAQTPIDAGTRVIRKVVCCGVDRTSGRPVPKPRA